MSPLRRARSGPGREPVVSTWTGSVAKRCRRGAAAGLVVATVLVTPAAPAAADARADDVVRRSSRATAEVDFRGAVRLTWFSSGTPSNLEVPVRASQGRVTVGEPGAGAPNAGVADRAVTTWFHSLEQAPQAGSKYQLRVTGIDEVAGRRVDVVEYRLSGRLVETLWADQTTGLALRRETVGEDGRPVRAMTFTQVEIATVGRPVSAVALVPNLRAVPGQQAPRTLPGGYELTDNTTRDGVSQAVYSDGLRTVSIFEQRGALDDAPKVKVPPVPQDVAGHQGRKYEWAGGTMVLWTDGRITTAVVGDGPPGEVVAAAQAVPERHLSVVERLAEAGRHVIDLLG